jgi:hypothetical protein
MSITISGLSGKYPVHTSDIPGMPNIRQYSGRPGVSQVAPLPRTQLCAILLYLYGQVGASKFARAVRMPLHCAMPSKLWPDGRQKVGGVIV